MWHTFSDAFKALKKQSRFQRVVATLKGEGTLNDKHTAVHEYLFDQIDTGESDEQNRQRLSAAGAGLSEGLGSRSAAKNLVHVLMIAHKDSVVRARNQKTDMLSGDKVAQIAHQIDMKRTCNLSEILHFVDGYMHSDHDPEQNRRNRQGAMDNLEDKLIFEKPRDWSNLLEIRRTSFARTLDSARRSITPAQSKSNESSELSLIVMLHRGIIAGIPGLQIWTQSHPR